MRLLAIDAGTTVSGYVVLEDNRVIKSDVIDNEQLLLMLSEFCECDEMLLEMIQSMGMAVGQTTFTTVLWIGRFYQEWANLRGRDPYLIYRQEVKNTLCGSSRAKDANIRQRCIDILGPQGTKKDKGPTYGVKSHSWQALGVALTFREKTWTSRS